MFKWFKKKKEEPRDFIVKIIKMLKDIDNWDGQTPLTPHAIWATKYTHKQCAIDITYHTVDGKAIYLRIKKEKINLSYIEEKLLKKAIVPLWSHYMTTLRKKKQDRQQSLENYVLECPH